MSPYNAQNCQMISLVNAMSLNVKGQQRKDSPESASSAHFGFHPVPGRCNPLDLESN